IELFLSFFRFVPILSIYASFFVLVSSFFAWHSMVPGLGDFTSYPFLFSSNWCLFFYLHIDRGLPFVHLLFMRTDSSFLLYSPPCLSYYLSPGSVHILGAG